MHKCKIRLAVVLVKLSFELVFFVAIFESDIETHTNGYCSGPL